MPSHYDPAEASSFVDRYAEHGEAVALRVYTSRLLGRDPTLVLHGGGNTSVKATVRDLLGRDVEVLCVKGSGWDLAAIEPPGLPAVRLAALRELRQLDTLSDQAMVNAVRGALLDSSSPNPSVETLLHAFLPHAFVDHTHANAILTLADQADPEPVVRAALGDDVLVLPWIMPGFPLAKAVADAFERQPDCRGIVLLKHGLFTFGDTARESYERTIELVDRAEQFIAGRTGGVPAMLRGEPAPLSADERQRALATALPVLRGACAERQSTAVGEQWQRVVADARTADDLASFAAHAAAPSLSASNPITPDHVIRTKGRYLFLARDDWREPDRVRAAVDDFRRAYHRYYQTHAQRLSPSHMHSSAPVIAVLQGVGLVALHRDRKAARVAADVAEHTLRVKAAAHDLGDYTPLSDAELAEMEYWPLELAKLGKRAAPALAGQIALVTGAAGAIGSGIVAVLLEHGACVMATDIDGDRLRQVGEQFAGERLALSTADLTRPDEVAAVFDQCAATFGGVDCVVPNAGIAHVSQIEAMAADDFARVLEVNTTGTMLVLREAAKVLRLQACGGSVVVQASKNTFAPGKAFGAYSASKAAVLQLARVAAIELAALSVRVNIVNADAVFGDAATPSQLWQAVGPDRMRARGLDQQQLREFYRERSLLKQPVLARHVGEAVLFFAQQRTPTTGAVLPVDGGLPEAFPR